MATYQITETTGKSAGVLELDDRVFGVPVDRHLLHSAVVMQRASFRQGTSSTRGRGEVAGSGKKPWKQKHTGRARAGSVRSPIWRHGGIVFGPKPRSYSYRIPRKVYRSALRAALSSKVNSSDAVIVPEIAIADQKTKSLFRFLLNLGLSSNVLIVVGDGSEGLERAGRNLPGVRLCKVEDLNVYDILRYEKLLIVQSEVARVQEYWL